MRFYETRTIINAPRIDVWHVLTDAERLASGDFGLIRFEGRIGQGESIKLWSEVSPNRAFPLKVTVVDEPTHMVWTGGMPLGLFTGTRHFHLTEVAGGTEFHMREDYTGLMAPLIFRSIPDLTQSFEKFARALKAQTERTTQ